MCLLLCFLFVVVVVAAAAAVVVVVIVVVVCSLLGPQLLLVPVRGVPEQLLDLSSGVHKWGFSKGGFSD